MAITDSGTTDSARIAALPGSDGHPGRALFEAAKGTRIRSECYLPVLNIR